MLGGHNARRKSVGDQCRYLLVEKAKDKLGGPEMYKVARSALTAGVPGKRTEKIWEAKLEVGGLEASL